MKMTAVPPEAFTSKLLDKDHHERLILDIEKLALVAGVPPSVIWSRASSFCTPDEVNWLRHIRSTEDAGLAFMGKGFASSVSDKMLAMVGVFLRNYTDARLMPVQDVLSLLKSGDMPACTVLLIPNFCMEKDNAGDIASWEVSTLMGLLLSRSNRGLKTILYAPSMTTLEKQYGNSIREHIEDRYAISKASGFTPSKLAQE